MATTMNNKFFKSLLQTACMESTNSDGSINLVIRSHCVKYVVRVFFHPVTDEPTVVDYTLLKDKLAAPKEVTQ